MENIKEIIKDCYSKKDLCNRLNYPLNGSGYRKVNEIIESNNLDITHFDSNKNKRKYKIIEKTCPVCDSVFEARENHRDEKTTCSHACSNTYFRSGENHPNWKEISDDKRRKSRDICFKYHEKKCVVCGEMNIVEAHHFDGNNENDNPTNLIPICPTHHKYWHSKYKRLIEYIVIDYRKEFIDNYTT